MNSIFNGIKTVFVDIDDTIWDFSANSPLALSDAYDHFIGDPSRKQLFLDEYKEINHQLWQLYHYGKIEKDHLVAERFRVPLEKIGHDNLAIAPEMNEWYLNNLASRPTIVPGADTMLAALSQRFTVAALSNGFVGIQGRKLRAGGIDRYIQFMVLSEEVGVTKPLPGIFEHAAARCGCMPSEIVMIGDNYDADIVGAHNMGWRTIYFNRHGNVVENNIATATVQSLSQVTEML